MLGDAQTFVGSLEHATQAMPELLKLRTIQQGMTGRSSDRDFGYLAKALEQGGVAGDAEKLKARVDTFARWMEVYRETFSVDAINQFYAGLKGPIGRSLSENFLRGAGGHFIQELGGHATGNALTQLYMAVVAGRAQPRALAALNELGLLDQDKIVTGGPFGVKAAKPGAVAGSSLFSTDPDKWIHDVLGPALDKFSGDKREELEASLFSDATARNIADKILHQWATIQKDAGFVARAPGIAAHEQWSSRDPTLAATAAASQWDNVLREANRPIAPLLTEIGKMTAGALDGLARFNDRNHWAGVVEEGAALGALTLASLKAARFGITKFGEWSGEGMAKGLGTGAPKAPWLGTPRDFGRGFTQAMGGAEEVAAWGKNVAKGVGAGVILGLADMAANYALDKVEQHAFGWTPESKARNEEEIARKAHDWWRSHGAGQPALVAQGTGAPRQLRRRPRRSSRRRKQRRPVDPRRDARCRPRRARYAPRRGRARARATATRRSTPRQPDAAAERERPRGRRGDQAIARRHHGAQGQLILDRRLHRQARRGQGRTGGARRVGRGALGARRLAGARQPA